MRPWLERELERQFAPAAAPDSLWSRIERQRLARRPSVPRMVLWPAVAALILAASADLLWQLNQARKSLRDLAQFTKTELRAVADANNVPELKSGDPAEIRRWVKDNGNIEIEMTAQPSPGVRLLGARLVRVGGKLIAAVGYRVGENTATLLVSQNRLDVVGGSPAARHLVSQTDGENGQRLYLWNMRDESYTIAWAGPHDSEGACLLCHTPGHRQL